MSFLLDKKYGFAVIGAGAIARVHCEAVAAHPNARLVCVSSSTLEKASKLAGLFSVEGNDSLEKTLLNKVIDVVCVATPSHTHGDIALKALRAGKHVLVEKPMDITLEKTDALIEASHQLGKKLAVAFQYRLLESVQKIKKEIEAGRLGKIISCSARVPWFRSKHYFSSSNWRGTREHDGGGAVMNQGIHLLDLMLFLAGPVASVQSQAGTLHHDVEVEDTLAAVMRFENGAIGTFFATTAAFPGLPPVLEIYGTKGSVILQNQSVFFRCYEEDGVHPGDYGLEGEASSPYFFKTNVWEKNGHHRVVADLVTSLETGREPEVNGVEGRKSLALVEALYHSQKSQAIIFLTQETSHARGKTRIS